jgi:DNA anti-recombination protein RmuC
VRSLGERLNEIEGRIDRARQSSTLPGAYSRKIVDAVLAAVDTRLREQAAQFDQKLAAGLAALREEISQQHAADQDRSRQQEQLLRDQITGLHREFAQSVAMLVDEQITAGIEHRVAPLEQELQPIRTEVAGLQERLGETDREMVDMVLALGRLCLQTAERLSGPRLQSEDVSEVPASEASQPEVSALDVR